MILAVAILIGGPLLVYLKVRGTEYDPRNIKRRHNE